MSSQKELTIAGSAVYWNCAVESDREKIATELADLGHEDLAPGERTGFAAAKRAAQVVFPGSGYHLGNLEKQGGVTIERVVHSTDTENDYPQVAYLTVDETGHLTGVVITDDSLDINQRIQLRESLRTNFDEAKAQCGATSIGIALTKACKKLGGVSLRDNGGVWFIPEFSQDLFRKIVTVFEGSALAGRSLVQSLTVAKTDETIRGVHESLCGGITERIAEIRTELARDPGKRLRANRTAEVSSLLDQAKSYESLLGDNLEDTKKALTELKTQLTVEKVAAAASVRTVPGAGVGGLGALEANPAAA
ncbi:MAG: DUF6744 family protein [Planctomycetaceae bacterium]